MALDRASLTLKNGRKLSYRLRRHGDTPEGDAGAPWILFFHGFPGSSVQMTLVSETARSLGYNILAFDRPGIGGSTFYSERTILSTADDFLEATQQLGVRDFHILTVSGGTPYGLAAAVRGEKRVLSVSTICGLGPLAEENLFRMLDWPAKVLIQLVRHGGCLARALFGVLDGAVRRNPRAFMRNMMRGLDRSDLEELARPELGSKLVQSVREGLEQGGQGLLHDLRLLSSPWGFEISGIVSPTQVWHGARDRVVHPEHARYLAGQLKQAKLSIVEGEGHYSVPLKYRREVIANIPGPGAASAVHP